MREAVVAKAQIDAFPQRILIELERNQDINASIRYYSKTIGAYDAAAILADAIKITICQCGTSSGVASAIARSTSR